jgi:hypothetical protein
VIGKISQQQTVKEILPMTIILAIGFTVKQENRKAIAVNRSCTRPNGMWILTDKETTDSLDLFLRIFRQNIQP